LRLYKYVSSFFNSSLTLIVLKSIFLFIMVLGY
jgi:hypothetical protein